jgi:hypothetical protein
VVIRRRGLILVQFSTFIPYIISMDYTYVRTGIQYLYYIIITPSNLTWVCFNKKAQLETVFLSRYAWHALNLLLKGKFNPNLSRAIVLS